MLQSNHNLDKEVHTDLAEETLTKLTEMSLFSVIEIDGPLVLLFLE